MSLRVVSKDCRMDIENVAVLPVPDCAWAMTSLPLTMGFIALCWIAEGFSNPEKKEGCRGNQGLKHAQSFMKNIA